MGIGVVKFDGKINRYVSGDIFVGDKNGDGVVDRHDSVRLGEREFLADVYEPDKKWFINFGFGVEVVLTENVSLKGQLRDYIWKAEEIYYLNTTNESIQIRNDIWGHVFTVEFGLDLNF